MPELQYPERTSGVVDSTTSDTSVDANMEEDLQDTLGNEALLALMTSHSVGETDVESLWESAMSDQDTEAPTLAQGTVYTVTSADLGGGVATAWKEIARANGMSEDRLQIFNQQILSVRNGTVEDASHLLPQAIDLESGVQIYIPSADEILFAQCAGKADTMPEAIQLWNELSGAHNVEMMRVARSRASDKVGTGYGTAGDEGIFYTPNPEIAGASSKRSEKVDDITNYRVNWGANFWKCSVFMHDVVYGAGYEPDLKENNHYQLAGRLQESQEYEEIAVENARPGDCWQRFGGTSSDESHNAILSSFVNIESVDEETDRWTFHIIGAENERAAESERAHTMKKGTNEIVNGKLIRFFRPRFRREDGNSGSH